MGTPKKTMYTELDEAGKKKVKQVSLLTCAITLIVCTVLVLGPNDFFSVVNYLLTLTTLLKNASAFLKASCSSSGMLECTAFHIPVSNGYFLVKADI